MEFTPEDLKALVIGVVGSVTVLVGHRYYTKFQRSTILNNIEMLKYEKEHLEGIKRSSIEMSRHSFMAIFVIFMFISIAECLSHLARFIDEGLSYYSLVAAMFYFVIALVSYQFVNGYKDLKNFKNAIEKIDTKIERLSKKL